MPFVKVALDVPAPVVFDYRASNVSKDDIGQRALVPFRKKIVVGIIVGISDVTSLCDKPVRPILNVLRDTPPLPVELLTLLKFASDYYHHPFGQTVLNSLPTRLRRREAIKFPVRMAYRLTQAGRALAADGIPPRASAQREILRALAQNEAGIANDVLRKAAPRASAALKVMLKHGWVETVTLDAANPGQGVGTIFASEPQLTDEQEDALRAMRSSSPGFQPWLLLGVTGSGKTELYLQLIADILAQGQQVLLLVPEINLTPQLEALVRTRFRDHLVVALHSGLNESERLQNWLAAQSGQASIVLGTRLAVFAPLPKLGLIVVDEEHDTSFKQSEGLRYSARDLALVRAKQRGIAVVLGSATPALETFSKALSGAYHMVVLKNRVNAMPRLIECIDTRGASLIDGLSQPLIASLHATLKRGDQSLVFINRRGYAPVLLCRACGWISACARCSARLVFHQQDQALHCHLCGHKERSPAACPHCGNPDLYALGHGTQRIETALSRLFPQARILRIDRDTTRRRQAWPTMRDRIRKQEVDILVGTQMLAKGHDFPALNLVGVLNADNSLYSTDFRAAERLFALLTQVAGRAGRGTRDGLVLVQTDFPAHPLYEALRGDDYAAYARTLLAERRQAEFPPYMHQALMRSESTRMETALGFLSAAARYGTRIADGVTLYDAVPAGVPKVAGVQRAQLMMQSPSRAKLHQFLQRWTSYLFEQKSPRVRWSLDVDPQEL